VTRSDGKVHSLRVVTACRHWDQRQRSNLRAPRHEAAVRAEDTGEKEDPGQREFD
jgi:hypothetical protein